MTREAVHLDERTTGGAGVDPLWTTCDRIGELSADPSPLVLVEILDEVDDRVADLRGSSVGIDCANARPLRASGSSPSCAERTSKR